MLQTIEAIVSPDGKVQLKEPVKLDTPRRALLTLLAEEPQETTKPQEKRVDFSRLLGIALKGPTNPNPRFKNEDDLWKDEPW